LSRSFKTFTQFSFVEYINSLRIAESCKLLHNTRLSVLEIALKCGFGSVTQYGRWFKKLVGKSPVKYRDDRRDRETGIARRTADGLCLQLRHDGPDDDRPAEGQGIPGAGGHLRNRV
ncbi:MAG: helix-turn-helix transcriptional regulator, partial [Ruminococcus sp.]|nr:helix-turn-helix transcriptional regulator [Ruminococcus sp.]